MDRTREYAGIIRRVIEYYAQFKPAYGDIDVETVFDEERGHYELILKGWDGAERVHGALIHVDLRGDKVWIEFDGTETGVVEDFLQAGIPREHIVLAFHSPCVRKHTGFAVA
jgi:hypothetical protein